MTWYSHNRPEAVRQAAKAKAEGQEEKAKGSKEPRAFFFYSFFQKGGHKNIMMPVSFNNPEELKQRIEEYFDRCENSKKTYELKNGDIKIRQEFPTMSGLAVYLGVTRDTLYSYMNGESKTGNSEEVSKSISDTLSYARQRVATALSQCSLSGDAEAKIASMLLTAMGETTPEVQNTVNVIIQGDSDAYSV